MGFGVLVEWVPQQVESVESQEEGPKAFVGQIRGDLSVLSRFATLSVRFSIQQGAMALLLVLDKLS